MPASRTFEAPGPGAWELETTHFSRPISTFLQRPFLAGFPVGFAESAARYSLMFEGFEPRLVHGFVYVRPKVFGAPPDAKGPPPKVVFQLLTRLVPKIRRRLRAGAEAFEEKLWREDLRRWDEEVKPAAIRAHRALQDVEPRGLSDGALVDHLAACERHVEVMHRQHHQFTFTCGAPVGDFLAHAAAWTGRPTGEVLQALRGSSQVSLGVAAGELDALAQAIRADAEAKSALGAGGPADRVLEALRERPGEVSAATRAYLDVVGQRCLGYDVSSARAVEMPEVLVRAIRAAVEGATAAGDASKERVAALRSAVPGAHRARFDELLDEARHVNRLRDERCHYSDGWATGLARRALLEAGRRLVERGAFDDPALGIDATVDEIIALLRGEEGPGLDELHERRTWRTTRNTGDADVPRWFGAPPSPPPPAEWLPEHGRRAQRAISTMMDALFKEPEAMTTTRTVRGLPVSPGVAEGVARVVTDEADFGRIQRGDVLVTRATSPYFNVVLPLLGAIVTDRGGQLCHAAIVSREYGIPGVVGTRDATSVIKDGARVRVDGAAGLVEVLS
jgi:pyruvate,water dikinase